MATNLLLEGDDLEALLLRAAAEGGANARILRAEKVRQGGFMGFFAREHFEVAVEIPDAVDVTDPTAGSGAGSGGAPAATATASRPGPQARPGTAALRAGGAYGAASSPAGPGASTGSDDVDDEAVAALVAAMVGDRMPEPGRMAAEGLLGLADRVSAAERAATGSARSDGRSDGGTVDVRTETDRGTDAGTGRGTPGGARSRSAFERYLPADAAPEPADAGAGAGGWWAGVPTPAHGIAALSAAGGIDGTVPWTEPVAAAAARAVDERLAAERSAGARPVAARQHAVEDRPTTTAATAPVLAPVVQDEFADEQAAAEAVIRAAVEQRRGGVPHEPAAGAPARPSTTRPEFTALLDTLRSDTRPAAKPAPAVVTAGAPSPALAAAMPAAMPAQRAGSGGSRVSVTVDDAPAVTLGGPVVDATPEPDAGRSAPREGFAPFAPFAEAVEAAVRAVVTESPEQPAAEATEAARPVAEPVAAAPAEQPGSPAEAAAPAPQPAPPAGPAASSDAAQPVPRDPGEPLAPVHPLHATPQDAVSRIGQPVALVAGSDRRTPVPPLVAVAPTVQAGRGLLVALGAEDEADDEPYEPEHVDTDGSTDLQVSAERRALRRLGVPASWTRRYRGTDRFSGVLRMLDRLPAPEIDPDTRIVAVVGPAHLVALEAHRTALDLTVEDRPRAVVVVPPRQGQARRAAIARAQKLAAGVVAIATDAYDDVEAVLDSLQAVGAGAVVAVVEAGRPLAATQAWLEALDDVDALVVDGAAGVPDPAAVLQLDVPVVRLDGIPVDRVTWSALLCARMLTALGLDPTA